MCSGSWKCQRCGTAASFHDRSQPSGSFWIITTVNSVLFTAQCKRLEFLVEIQLGFQDQQFHLQSCQSWKNHGLEMAFCSQLEHVEFLLSTVSIYITLFPSPVLSRQFSWERARSSSVCGGFFAFGTLKWEEGLRKRKSRRVPALSPSLLLTPSTPQGNADTWNTCSTPKETTRN